MLPNCPRDLFCARLSVLSYFSFGFYSFLRANGNLNFVNNQASKQVAFDLFAALWFDGIICYLHNSCRFNIQNEIFENLKLLNDISHSEPTKRTLNSPEIINQSHNSHLIIKSLVKIKNHTNWSAATATAAVRNLAIHESNYLPSVFHTRIS